MITFTKTFFRHLFFRGEVKVNITRHPSGVINAVCTHHAEETITFKVLDDESNDLELMEEYKEKYILKILENLVDKDQSRQNARQKATEWSHYLLVGDAAGVYSWSWVMEVIKDLCEDKEFKIKGFKRGQRRYLSNYNSNKDGYWDTVSEVMNNVTITYRGEDFNLYEGDGGIWLVNNDIIRLYEEATGEEYYV